MKINFNSLQDLQPTAIESLAQGASEAGRQALAGFLKRFMEVRFAQVTQFAVPTSVPQARWSEQPLTNNSNKHTKGE